MPDAAAHLISGGIAGAMTAGLLQSEGNVDGGELIAGAFAGAAAGRVPDILEPAVNPGHRAFFHSWSTAFLVGYGMIRAYHWEPTDDLERILRWGALVGGAAYLTHLALDAGTPHGLPLA